MLSMGLTLCNIYKQIIDGVPSIRYYTCVDSSWPYSTPSVEEDGTETFTGVDVGSCGGTHAHYHRQEGNPTDHD